MAFKGTKDAVALTDEMENKARDWVKTKEGQVMIRDFFILRKRKPHPVIAEEFTKVTGYQWPKDFPTDIRALFASLPTIK